MTRRLKQTLLLLCFYPLFGFAQQLNYVPGDLLVRLSPNTNIKTFLHQWTRFDGKPTGLHIEKQLVRDLNIWRVSFDPNQINENAFLKAIQQDRLCVAAQFNHFVTNRQTIPNDELFTNQWHHINLGGNGGVVDADMDTDQAWDITTGGVTISGDTIVVAVLDDGIQASHPDIKKNLWINHAEIPNNGIDDDANGYVDDYRGWNISTNSDELAGGGHGTPVAGIIGAVGNNGIGISGVNWRVKLMIVKNDFNTTEAAVFEAYAYPLAMRTKFNNTNGAAGAFVVATNASWGVNGGNPDDAPLWCSLFDELGEEGILSCGATANLNLNVDVDGDLPTGCSSDFLIAVTNMKRNDVKETSAAYGSISVDLGAFGSGVFTLGNNNNYTTFGGTSGATPQVTGAIALLYSAPCPDLPVLYNDDPEAAALLIKEYILTGVDPNSSLNNITSTGGRINIYNSVQLVIDNCSPCLPPYNLSTGSINTTTVSLNWASPVDAVNSTLKWRLSGSVGWNTIPLTNSPFTLSGLNPCTNYQFQVEANCSNTTSGFSNIFPFKTDGCCEPPGEVRISDIGLNSCTIDFDSVTAAISYNILITNLNTNINTTLDVTDHAALLEMLESCTPYRVRVKTICANGQTTIYNNGTTFTTYGCGACTDFTYCPSQGDLSDFEWISHFSFNSLNNTSGNDDGYGNFTGLFTEVATYGTYPISITPTFAGPTYEEYFKVWIDYNQNGVFEDATELVFDPLGTTSETISGEVIIPPTALPGLTRMRVIMKYVGDFDMEEPEACTEVFGFGEVEDYCLQIVEGTPPNCDLPFHLDTLVSSYSIVTLSWEDPTGDHVNHNLRYRKSGTFSWTQLDGISPPIEISNLELCTPYEAQVAANCVDMGTSGYTNIFVFSTDCVLNNNNPITTDLKLAISPNPVNDFVNIAFELPKASTIKISLMSIDGKRILLLDDYFAEAGKHTLLLENMDRFPAGLYWLIFETSEEMGYGKVLLVE